MPRILVNIIWSAQFNVEPNTSMSQKYSSQNHVEIKQFTEVIHF